MARARNIKPGFFKNEDLAECSPWARLCFIGLWTLADREGRLEDRPKRIKGELFAFDSVEVEPLLQELEHRGFIVRYRFESLGIIQITTFSKHQNPHHREPESDLPPPQSLGLDGDATPPKPEALPPSHDTKAAGKPRASPRLEGDESAKDGGKAVLIPDTLIPDTLIPDPGEGQERPSPPPAEPPPERGPGNAYGLMARALMNAGVQRVSSGNVQFRALVDAGVTTDEFMAYVDKALKADDPFAYLLATVKGERERAAAAPVHAARSADAKREARDAKAKELLFGRKAGAEVIDV